MVVECTEYSVRAVQIGSFCAPIGQPVADGLHAARPFRVRCQDISLYCTEYSAIDSEFQRNKLVSHFPLFYLRL